MTIFWVEGPSTKTLICLTFSEVLYLAEAEITFTCPINYSTFPFHEAKCKLRMTSFNEKNDSMIFTTDLEHWKPDQVKVEQVFSCVSVYGKVSFLYLNPWLSPQKLMRVTGSVFNPRKIFLGIAKLSLV